MKFVITGGPCSGKTTTVNMLGKLGFGTVREAARDVIEKEQEKGSGCLPWADWYGFQLAVLELQLEREGKADGITFLDRGMVDSIAYCRLNGAEPSREILQKCRQNGYSLVFLLEQLPDFVNDCARREDGETGRKISELIERAYAERGYKIIKVPVMPPEERARFVLERAREVIK